MKKEQKVWAMTLIAFWCLAPNQTKARQDSLKTLRLNEVVVTATKFPKELSETGKVVTVIDSERLTASAGKDLAQVLNEQAGLVIVGANSNPGKDKSVFLRGAGSQYTLIMIDGVPLSDPSSVGGGAYDLRLLSIDHVERIEILKGSQSTLYGTDAIAGVINIITKTSAGQPLSATLQGSNGSFNTWRANATVQGSLNSISYAAGYSRTSTDGVTEALDVNDADTFDRDGMEQDAFHAQLQIKPTEAIALKPFLRYTNFWSRYDAGAFTDSRLNQNSGTLLNTGIHGEYAWKKGSLNTYYTFDRTRRSFASEFFNGDFEGRFQHAEAFARHSITGQLQLLGGASLQHYNMLDSTATELNPATTIVSPYVSLFYHNRGLSVEAGGRYNNHSTYGSNYTYSINPAYLWNKQLKIFLNLSTGFKAPSLYQLFGQFGANPDLKPERSQNLEGGLEWFQPAGKWSVRVVTFQRRIRDVIIFTAGNNVNFDEQNDHGLEVEPALAVNKQLRLSAFYTYVTGEVTTTANGVETKTNNLIRRPKHSAGLNVAWQVAKRLSTSMNITWCGKRNDIFFDLTTFSTNRTTLSPYALLDVYVAYAFANNKITWFIDARNLLDQDYQESAGFTALGINAYSGIQIKL